MFREFIVHLTRASATTLNYIQNEDENEDEDGNSKQKRSAPLNFQRFKTAAMPMVMRQFISMQGWRVPSDVTSISTPTGPSYHGAI